MSSPDDSHVEAPEGLCCPISKDIMQDPVTLFETGQTHDRASIESWFARVTSSCPLTGVTVVSKPLVTKFLFKSQVAHSAGTAGAGDLPSHLLGAKGRLPALGEAHEGGMFAEPEAKCRGDCVAAAGSGPAGNLETYDLPPHLLSPDVDELPPHLRGPEVNGLPPHLRDPEADGGPRQLLGPEVDNLPQHLRGPQADNLPPHLLGPEVDNLPPHLRRSEAEPLSPHLRGPDADNGIHVMLLSEATAAGEAAVAAVRQSSLFVKGFPDDVDRAEITKAFRDHGALYSIILDGSGNGEKQAQVAFLEVHQRDAAVAHMNGRRVWKRPICVACAMMSDEGNEDDSSFLDPPRQPASSIREGGPDMQCRENGQHAREARGAVREPFATKPAPAGEHTARDGKRKNAARGGAMPDNSQQPARGRERSAHAHKEVHDSKRRRAGARGTGGLAGDTDEQLSDRGSAAPSVPRRPPPAKRAAIAEADGPRDGKRLVHPTSHSSGVQGEQLEAERAVEPLTPGLAAPCIQRGRIIVHGRTIFLNPEDFPSLTSGRGQFSVEGTLTRVRTRTGWRWTLTWEEPDEQHDMTVAAGNNNADLDPGTPARDAATREMEGRGVRGSSMPEPAKGDGAVGERGPTVTGTPEPAESCGMCN